MSTIQDYLHPSIIAKLSFWIGGILAALTLFFRVIEKARLGSEFYVIQVPFGLLFLLTVSVIIATGIFILTNLYDLLNRIEDPGYYSPVTKIVLLLLILLIIISLDPVAEMVYEAIKIPYIAPI